MNKSFIDWVDLAVQVQNVYHQDHCPDVDEVTITVDGKDLKSKW